MYFGHRAMVLQAKSIPGPHGGIIPLECNRCQTHSWRVLGRLFRPSLTINADSLECFSGDA